MTELPNWIAAHVGSLGVLGAAIAFSWSVVQFVWQRRRESQEREFDKYHELIKRLVSPDGGEISMFMDRQIAVVFELRHFNRYYECTERILSALQQSWSNEEHFRLRQEIDLTLQYIKSHK